MPIGVNVVLKNNNNNNKTQNKTDEKKNTHEKPINLIKLCQGARGICERPKMSTTVRICLKHKSEM